MRQLFAVRSHHFGPYLFHSLRKFFRRFLLEGEGPAITVRFSGLGISRCEKRSPATGSDQRDDHHHEKGHLPVMHFSASRYVKLIYGREWAEKSCKSFDAILSVFYHRYSPVVMFPLYP